MKIETENPKVYLDITISSKKIGRIVIELFEQEAPKATLNFIHLCKSDKKLPDGSLLTLKGTAFQKVIKNFMIQGGNSKNSIYTTDSSNGEFEDENLGDFDSINNLAMANSGPNTNLSQFFINTYPSPHLNGKHTIFGKVLYGKSTVRTIEYSKVDKNSIPSDEIIIEDCGEWTEDLGVPVYNASYDEKNGDIYEEFPDDDDHFDKEKAIESFEAINKIKDSGSAFFKVKNYQDAFFKYRKALRYINELIPDQDSEPELAPKFEDLKKKVYLNLSLTCLNMKDYKKAIDYSTYLLDADLSILPTEKAKGYYRRGVSKYELGKFKDALEDLKQCEKFNPNDKVVKAKIEETETRIELEKTKEKLKYAKFFGGQ